MPLFMTSPSELLLIPPGSNFSCLEALLFVSFEKFVALLSPNPDKPEPNAGQRKTDGRFLTRLHKIKPISF